MFLTRSAIAEIGNMRQPMSLSAAETEKNQAKNSESLKPMTNLSFSLFILKPTALWPIPVVHSVRPALKKKGEKDEILPFSGVPNGLMLLSNDGGLLEAGHPKHADANPESFPSNPAPRHGFPSAFYFQAC